MASSADTIRLRQHVDQRLVGLRQERFSWWTHWRELAEHILPRRYHWLVTPNRAGRGSPINQRIIDSTGTLAARTLAAGMMSGITSPGRPWFRLTIDDQDLAASSPVKIWLDAVTSRLLHVFAESNFYNGLATLYFDLAVFGTAPMIIYEDYEDVIRCFNPCAGEYYLANSDRLDVDTLYREFVLTARQIGQRFGLDNASETVKAAHRTGGAALDLEIVVGHAIEPNDTRIEGLTGPRGMKYRELYWEMGAGQALILQQRFFHEFPAIAPRWDLVSNDAYGRSPAMDALGDIKQLQLEQKRKAQAIDKMVNPPMIADVALKNEPASLLPGGVTYVPSTAGAVGFKPVFEVMPPIAELKDDIAEVQGRIRSVFFNDLFLMISQLDTVRTATEIDARREEKLIQLGPVLERFENEALDPAIARTYAIMDRARLFPPPAALHGRQIKVEYVSVLAQQQRAASTAAIERFSAQIGSWAAARPDVLDNVDFDEMAEEYGDLLGVSPKILVASAKVAALRSQRAKGQAAQQAMQQTLAGVQGAQVLSKTEIGGGQNALGAILGTGRDQSG
jgi:Bacteriophage head to tail connecting protein